MKLRPRLPPVPRPARVRALLRWLSLMLAMHVIVPVQAAAECGAADVEGNRRCVARLASGAAERILQQQDATKWCWAAALSMVFAHHGFTLRQHHIVEDLYGSPLNVGVPTDQFAQLISREWNAQEGWFRTRVIAQTAPPGRTVRASTLMLVADLAANRPVLVSTHGHALVVVALEWVERGRSLRRILGGTVLDPVPGAGMRPLATRDLDVSMLARIWVEPVERSTPPVLRFSGASLPPQEAGKGCAG